MCMSHSHKEALNLPIHTNVHMYVPDAMYIRLAKEGLKSSRLESVLHVDMHIYGMFWVCSDELQ
jgi:hypothetical protein